MTDLASRIGWIERLVAFDTSSGKSNLPLIEDVSLYLESLGVPVTRVPNTDGDRANVYAVIGPLTEGGILLSGHSDVVPVTNQAWSTDPWTLSLRAGRLYGRGTCDMKGFCGIALSLVPEMLAAKLQRPIILALSYDEEIGCVGAPAMIRDIARLLPRPGAVIVGEPTMMTVVDGHKGSTQFRTRVTGVPGHSSDTENCASAVEIAAQLITRLVEIRMLNRARADSDTLFQPPYTTITSNLVSGGVQQNVMAHECLFTWDLRNLPSDNVDACRQAFDGFAQELVERYAAAGIAIEIITETVVKVPALRPDPDGLASQLARRLTGANQIQVASYASEAGQFQEAGFSTVLCGPGSIEQAHKPDEYVSLDQIERCTRFLRRIIDEVR